MQENTHWKPRIPHIIDAGRLNLFSFATASHGCSQTSVHFETLELNGITWTQGPALEKPKCARLLGNYLGSRVGFDKR